MPGATAEPSRDDAGAAELWTARAPCAHASVTSSVSSAMVVKQRIFRPRHSPRSGILRHRTGVEFINVDATVFQKAAENYGFL